MAHEPACGTTKNASDVLGIGETVSAEVVTMNAAPVDKTEDFVSMQEAARMLGISMMTVHRIIARGDITKYRLPTDRRRVLLARKDVEALKTPQIDQTTTDESADAVSAR